jgi:hypothetical protein
MKKWIVAAVALLLILAAIYLGSPVYAAYTLRNAAFAGDTARLAAGVDFPAVRDSLEPQLSAAITQRVKSDPRMQRNPYIAMGMMLLPSLVKEAVDALVTREAIAALMRGRRPGDTAKRQPNPDIERNAEYVDLDHFRVSLRNVRRNQDGADFLFERRGFATWKLVRVDLPADLLQEKQSL